MVVDVRRRPLAGAVVGLTVLATATIAAACPISEHHGHGFGPPTPSGLSNSAFASKGMRLMGRLDRAQLAAPGASTTASLASAWAWKDPQTNREYALVARSSDLAIVDVTRSHQPRLIGNVARAAGTQATTWRDVRVVGNWAFIGADGTNAGIQSFDLTRVRNVTSPQIFTADARFTGISNSHTLASNFSDPTAPYVYAVGANTQNGSSGGMQVLNVTNPTSLSISASYQSDGYIHETSVFTYNGPDAQHVGKKLAFNNNGGPGDPNVFSIADVSNPTAGVPRIGRAGYPNAAYSHQGWLTEDHRYYLINDELDELDGLTPGGTITHMFDVSNLDAPVYRGFYDWGDDASAVDHNLYIKGDLVFQANYTRGVRVFKLGDLASTDSDDWMKEIAFFDTYPQNDDLTFNGAWQVFAYLEGNKVLVSDINGGLFVLQLGLRGPFADADPNPGPSGFGPSSILVPEPSSVMGLGAIGALALRRRRR